MQTAYFIHALSPLHPGTGQAVGLVDLPIARLKATNIPFLPGSSVKGVFRDSFRGAGDESRELFLAAFGPEPKPEDRDKDHAGAVAFADARLVLLPVRSLHGTFAYATCPLLLRLARQDLVSCRVADVPAIPAVAEESALVTATSRLVPSGISKVFLEDLDLTSVRGPLADAWAGALGRWLFPGEEATLAERLAILDDETMTFLWETGTQIDARVRLTKTGVVASKALWYEESLPAETVLVGLASATDSRRAGAPFPAEELMAFCLGAARNDLQFGGKATVGRGRARLLPVSAN